MFPRRRYESIVTKKLTLLTPLPRQHVEVPETLLKKRKQTEKAREERLAAATAARKVSLDVPV